jgi:hypothetical protein
VTASGALNIAGLLMSLAGVVLLFQHGMPYRVRTGGSSIYVSSTSDPKEARAERRDGVFGWLGLILIIPGTAAQIAAVICTSA